MTSWQAEFMSLLNSHQQQLYDVKPDFIHDVDRCNAVSVDFAESKLFFRLFVNYTFFC